MTQQRRNAIVVDDSRQTADSLAQMLGLLAFDVQTCYSPRQALETFETAEPDLVLLDINMPGINGFEVLGFFRRDPRLEKVPVIFVSTEAQQENIDRAIEGGAAGFLAKPLDMDSLESALSEIFDQP